MATRKCPTCGKPFLAVPGSNLRAFCSERCQLIDLGAWVSERHAIPGEPVEGELPAVTPEKPE